MAARVLAIPLSHTDLFPLYTAALMVFPLTLHANFGCISYGLGDMPSRPSKSQPS